jgi:UDP-GlcNAc:undecaprenyl-phosphate/decaprenyl-phosphate GlcNAc-1-phosphate transferase
LFVTLARAERTGWRQRGTSRSGLHRAGVWIARWRQDESSQRTLLWIIATTVSALCLFVTVWVREVPQDFGALAALTALAVVVSLFGPRMRPLVLRVAAYVAVTFAAWLFIHHPREVGLSLTGPATWIVAGLAIAVAVFVRFTSDRRFETTPTDYLIVFALLALVLFGRLTGSAAGAASTVQFVSYAVVLFYSCEVIIGHLDRWKSVLGISAFAALLIVALRGLITPL